MAKGTGRRIAEARAKVKLNQSELARAMGVTPQAVQQWEEGLTSPRGNRIGKLAELLQVTPSWIQFGTEPSPGNGANGNGINGSSADLKRAEIYELLSLMNEKQLDQIKQLAISVRDNPSD
ncbi:helix-turn-helix domain-containing protein [Motiliproteus coralliicola]|uniref:Helix-turn-helix domain-containing protein n=1 Tax=Motiliproteus coralliicola TaxID=2283196 RepID=A0A369WXQ0_9GAMM|nr:helix-turn-helix domain-containing protein [Motiliproteus coralliicola]RDE25296.1 helix-turn-helix domain-containing protein [Motiliproteus coralliicola]